MKNIQAKVQEKIEKQRHEHLELLCWGLLLVPKETVQSPSRTLVSLMWLSTHK